MSRAHVSKKTSRDSAHFIANFKDNFAATNKRVPLMHNFCRLEFIGPSRDVPNIFRVVLFWCLWTFGELFNWKSTKSLSADKVFWLYAITDEYQFTIVYRGTDCFVYSQNQKNRKKLTVTDVYNQSLAVRGNTHALNQNNFFGSHIFKRT